MTGLARRAAPEPSSAQCGAQRSPGRGLRKRSALLAMGHDLRAIGGWRGGRGNAHAGFGPDLAKPTVWAELGIVALATLVRATGEDWASSGGSPVRRTRRSPAPAVHRRAVLRDHLPPLDRAGRDPPSPPGLGTLAADRPGGERKTLPVNRSVRTELRQTRRPSVVARAAGGSALAGLCIGFGLGRMMDAPHGRMTGILAIAAGIGLAIAALHFLRILGRAGASRLEMDNGPAAPIRHAIEHALAAPGCAVAHSVRTIARDGVIDHLVATPVRLWVITAIDRRIPREELPNVLAEIADYTTAVWDWAPQGTPVRGCLVVGRERRQTRTRYDYGNGPVVVHTPRNPRARAQGRVRALTRARRARRERGGQARTGIRIARVLDVTLTCGPPGWAPISNLPSTTAHRPNISGTPPDISRSFRQRIRCAPSTSASPRHRYRSQHVDH